jgi:hypothetical protein
MVRPKGNVEASLRLPTYPSPNNENGICEKVLREL